MISINWRKPAILVALHLSGSKIPRYLKEIERVSQFSRAEIVEYQQATLERLLMHAYENVPYYHRILPEAGVISGGKVYLEHFGNIPILTKDIIRREGKNLYSTDYANREPYENTSGGSTGEPVWFIQDREYEEWNIATKIYFNQVFGKQIGEREVKLWGSDRDIIEGTIGIKNKIRNFIYNRKFINSFKLSSQQLESIVYHLDTYRPSVVWSYVTSSFELARYLNRNGRTLLHPPDAFIVTAGMLSEPVRTYLEETLGTRVYNQYGSREVGPIACECRRQEGLHIFDFLQYIEVPETDSTGAGEVVVTNLRNFSMPLIRYRIGDTARLRPAPCSCGRESHMLESITGRTTDHFVLEDGTKISGGYFSHLLVFKKWVKKFQILQKGYSLIQCKIVVDGEINHREIKDIEAKMQLLMGDSCRVRFDFVEEIEPSESGKFRYVICEVPETE